MTKLEQLINDLCPNGVEYKCLGDIGQVKMCKRILKSQTNTTGGIPFYKIGTFGGEANAFISEELFQEYREKYSYPKVGEILISAAGTIGRTVVYDGELAYYQDSNIVWLAHDESHVLNTFLKYCYELKPWNVSSGGTIARLYNDNILKAKIPIPPLEVQCEIVRILDNFTELTAELTARKQQYEYYRDQLLSFENVLGGGTNKVQWRTLGEISDIISGFPFDSSQFMESGIRLMRGMNVKRGRLDFSESNNRYWSSYDGLEKYLLDANDIVIAMDGSLVGKSFGVVTKSQLPLLLVQRVARIRVTGANSRYVYHCVANSFSNYVDSKKTEGAVPHISLKDISKFKIPTPPITIQNRIAEVLDNFDAICSDLNIGLPAEIEARQKQYEYYRDWLLSFSKKGDTNEAKKGNNC